jgi:hypothetical protein
MLVRTLKVYVGVYAAQMRFEAGLSDAAPLCRRVVPERIRRTEPRLRPELRGVAGQRLVVRITVLTFLNGRCQRDPQAAALRGAPLVEAGPARQWVDPFTRQRWRKFGLLSVRRPFPAIVTHLILNDADVSAQLTVAGTSTSRTARFNQLATNRFYEGTILVADNEKDKPRRTGSHSTPSLQRHGRRRGGRLQLLRRNPCRGLHG